MAVSQNGWTANNRALVSKRNVPGTDVWLTVRNGVAGDLLLWAAAEFDKRVESIDNGRGQLDDWGYAERPIRGGVETSNHASGTAIDLNAPRHPLGAVNTFNATQRATIRQILREASGAIRWGGDYVGRRDDMHWEINTSEAGCRTAWNRIQTNLKSATEPEKKGKINMDHFSVPEGYAFDEAKNVVAPELIGNMNFEWTDSSSSIPSFGGGVAIIGPKHFTAKPVRLIVELVRPGQNGTDWYDRLPDVVVAPGSRKWINLPKGCYGISVGRVAGADSDKSYPVDVQLIFGSK